MWLPPCQPISAALGEMIDSPSTSAIRKPEKPGWKKVLLVSRQVDYTRRIYVFFFWSFQVFLCRFAQFYFFFCCQLPPSAGKLLDGHFSGTCPSSHERHQVRSVAVAVVVRGSLRGDCLRGPNWNVPRETQMVLKWSKGLKYEPAIGEAAPLHARFKLRYLPIYIFLHIEEVQHKFQKHWHIARGTKRYQSAGYSNRLPHILKLRVAYIEPNTLDLV